MLLKYVLMKKKINKSFLLIPIIYIAVIVLLVLFQFSKVQTFQLTQGPLIVSGTAPTGEESKARSILEIGIKAGPVEFSFSSSQPLVLEDETGTRQEFLPRRYNLTQNGISVEFESDINLSFIYKNNETLALRITPELPAQLTKIKVIALPYEIEKTAEITEAGALPIITIQDEKKYFLSLPAGSIINTNKQTLHLVTRRGAEEVASLEESKQPDSEAFTYWFEKQEAFLEQTVYQSTLTTFLDNTYQAWSGSRFLENEGTWSYRELPAQFNETLVTAYMAEATRREEAPAVMDKLADILTRNKEELSFLSCPVFGNLPEKIETLSGENQIRLTKIEQNLTQGNFRFLEEEKYISYLIHHAPGTLREELRSFLAGLGYEKFSLQATIGLLRLLTAPTVTVDTGAVSAAQLIKQYLFPGIIRIDNNMFLRDPDANRVNINQNIRAGDALQNYGKLTGQKVYTSLGRKLIISCLNLADSEGFMPEILYFNPSNYAPDHTEGFLPPEEVYPLITDNPYYPHYVPLKDQLGKSSWIYTASAINVQSRGADEMVLTINHPRRPIHYLVINGIPELQEMILFGIFWPGDPKFERYSSGWAYQDESQTLLMKIQQRTDKERVIIRY